MITDNLTIEEDEVLSLIKEIYDEAWKYRVPMYRVAEEAGITFATISQWRHGHRDPSLRNYLKVLYAVQDLTKDLEIQRTKREMRARAHAR